MPNLASWTREEEKAFENAIALHSICETNEQWDKIASMVPNKTIDEIKQHYQVLVEDLSAIEAGKVPLPNYENDEPLTTSSSKDHRPFSKEQRVNSIQGDGHFSHSSSMGNGTKGGSKLDQERKKGIPWTEEEHRLFLLGLDKFGKGDWRSISRNYVITRTPTQVASHAQKYFIRLNSMNRDRRRSSIHDITNVNGGVLSSSNQVPITGQQNTSSSSNPGVGPNKHRGGQNGNLAPVGLGIYGTQIGHPVSVNGTPTLTPPPLPPHMASAVGTPVMLPPPHYALPLAYPMPPAPMHR